MINQTALEELQKRNAEWQNSEVGLKESMEYLEAAANAKEQMIKAINDGPFADGLRAKNKLVKILQSELETQRKYINYRKQSALKNYPV